VLKTESKFDTSQVSLAVLEGCVLQNIQNTAFYTFGRVCSLDNTWLHVALPNSY